MSRLHYARCLFPVLVSFTLVCLPNRANAYDTGKTIVIAADLNEKDISVSMPLQDGTIAYWQSLDVEVSEYSQEEVKLIALVTMAEAEGESEEGKRLVIDTILNRVKSEYFPDTVYEVIYQPNQFASMWNGRIERCEVREDICELVKEEMAEQLDNEVIFFTAGGYGAYGTPMYAVGNHYFSSYAE